MITPWNFPAAMFTRKVSFKRRRTFSKVMFDYLRSSSSSSSFGVALKFRPFPFVVLSTLMSTEQEIKSFPLKRPCNTLCLHLIPSMK